MMSDELEALKHAKFWFFLHGPDEETQSKGWELPPRGKVIIKDEANKMVEVDKEVVEKTMRVFVQKEKILLLESIINSINSRSYTIRNIIDYMKFKAGN